MGFFDAGWEKGPKTLVGTAVPPWREHGAMGGKGS